MSNPQRFLVAGYDGWMQPFEGGDYVKYEDYHQLLVKRQEERDNSVAEIGRLKAEHADAQESYHLVNERTAIFIKENARLKAEVERSRDQYNGIIDTQLAVIDSLNAEVTDLKTTADRFKSEVTFLKSDNDRLRNNIAYLDKKLDEELDKGGQS